MTFRDIHVGGIFGELAAIDGKPRSASVEATSRCTVAAMSPDLFWETVRLEESGVIEKRGRTLVIPDFEKLRRVVEEREKD